METGELLKKVRKIEIKTRGLTNQIFSGEYHSAFKGRGMAFSEVREYFPGDDVRTIDWNVTARLSNPYVKIFEEERELTVVLLVDVSGSQDFGTDVQFKKDMITELSAIFAFSAIQNNDKIGILFFSDKIEKFIPPKKGKTHVLRIIRELLEFRPENTGTDIGNALAYLTNVLKKRSIVFILSDFLSPDFERPVRIASRRHDTVAVQIYDKYEESLPNAGLIHIRDSETGSLRWVDTSSKRTREAYSDWWNSKQKNLTNILRRTKVDHVMIRTDESYVAPLQNFFKRRESRR
jgi:uncharacterized protein (DUF58 family)